MSSAGLSITPSQGYRIEVSKLVDETVGETVGNIDNEISILAKLREVAGNESLKLLVGQVSLKNVSLGAGSKVKDMN